MDWVSTIADWVRATVVGQDWLSGVAPYVAAAPDWALVIPAPIVFFVIAIYAIGKARKEVEEPAGTFRKGLETVGLAPPAPKPATQGQLRSLEADVAALTAAQKEQIAALEKKLDAMNAALVAAGQATALGGEEKARRNEAVTGIVAEGGAAATQFEAGLLAGGDLDLTALKAEARADAERSAEKWRRIGALARGVNDAEALAAYEEAHRLQPEDFWTCVELARLYRSWKGDIVAARRVAEAAERAARGEREGAVTVGELFVDIGLAGGDLVFARTGAEKAHTYFEAFAASNPGSAEAQRDVSVSLERLGDVLVKAGDLSGARARFEASLGVRERLSAQNPGSAEAQWDVWVTLWRLAAMEGGGVRWGQVRDRLEAMQARGVLFPADQQFLEKARVKAAAEGA